MKKTLLFCFLLNCCSINIIHAQLFGGLIKSSNRQAVFPVVTIGTQQWMEKNLEVVTYSDGTVIPQVTNPADWANLTTGAWCYYNDDPATGAIYGKLFNWYAVMGIATTESSTPTSGEIAARKQLAPTGWHMPADAEYTTLINYLGGDAAAAGKLREIGTTHWSPNDGATNSSGFTALPGGYRHNGGSFMGISSFCVFWSTTQISTTNAWNRGLGFGNGSLFRHSDEKTYGFSVRCIKD